THRPTQTALAELRTNYPSQELTLLYKLPEREGKEGQYILYSGKEGSRYFPMGKEWQLVSKARGPGDFAKSDLKLLLEMNKLGHGDRFSVVEVGENERIFKEISLTGQPRTRGWPFGKNAARQTVIQTERNNQSIL